MAVGSGVRVGVVGGGVLGASVAVQLARRGAEVVLVTAGSLSDGASGRSLAWLNSFGRRSREYHALRLLGMRRYRELVAADADAPVRFDGGLQWAGPGEEAQLRETFEHLQSIGYPVEWLSREDVRRRVPGVTPEAVPDEGAVFAPDEGWVDLPGLVERMAAELAGLGGGVRTDAGPADLVTTGGRVSGVRFAGEVVGVDVAVLATGAAVPGQLRELGVAVPDATPAALLVRTAPVATPLRAVLNTPRVALRPGPGGTLAMDAGWSEREVGVREDGTYDVRPETVEGLLREATSVLDGVPPLAAASYGVGPKPVPGDGQPVLGPIDAVEGCHVAFTHSGATLGLVVGELLAEEIVTGRPAPDLAAFRPGRFATTTG